MNDDENGAVGEVIKKKPAGVFVTQPDGILFRLLLSVKYCSDEQAHSAAYFESTAKSSKQRIDKLIRAGYLSSISIGLSPASQEEIKPSGDSALSLGPIGLQGLPARGARRIRNQTTRILYLAPGGEEFLRTNLPSQYRFRYPVKPNPNGNWTHDLSIAKLFVDQLIGSVDERLIQVDKKWNWLTSHRGFNKAGDAILGTFSQSRDPHNLIPDSVVTHIDNSDRLFIEYDRGTKQIFRERGGLKYKDSVRANLEAYVRFFRMHYDRFFDDKRRPMVLYVVPDSERRKAILELAGREFGELVLRVRVNDGARRFLEFWAGGEEDYPPLKTTKEPEAIKTATPLETALALNQKLELRLNEVEAGALKNNVLVKQAGRIFGQLRTGKFPFELSPEWEEWLKGQK